MNSRPPEVLCGWLVEGFAIGALLLLAQVARGSGPAPAINVVVLDDQALELPPQTEVRRNDWTTWQARLPSFLGKLRLVAEFQRAAGDEAVAGASLYGLQVSAALAPERREALIASELARIHAATGRPSAVLAHSSAGTDQLRIIFQDARDYPPAHAAKFLRVLGEICPAVAQRRIAGSFGPFNPPPTIIFDPRAVALCETGNAEGAAARRWGVLEQTYLLPHYVLHLLATLNGNVNVLGDTFYPNSVPEPGSLAAKAQSRTELYIAGAGINSAAERGPTQVFQMALARAGRDSIVATIDLHDWKARGLTLDNPKTATEIRTYASMMSRHAEAQGKNIVFDVRPDLDPYLSFGKTFLKDAADYMKNSPLWKSESQLQALTFDSIVAGHKDVQPGGRTHGLFHSQAAYAWSQTKSTLNFVEVYKGAVGPDMLTPKINQVISAGGDVKLFTGGLDWWSAGNLRTKSTVQRLAKETGATALHDETWRGHGLPMGRGRFEVYSGHTKSASHLTLDPTLLGDRGLGQRQRWDGGVDYSEPNVYFLDLSGTVRKLGDRASGALDGGGGVGGTFRENEEEKVVVGIPMGGSKKKGAGFAAVDLLLFDADAQANGVGDLPLALPRFWMPDVAPGHLFGGGWTFEPVVLQGVNSIGTGTGARREAAVVPFETGNRLAYLPTSVLTEDGAEAPPPEAPTVAFTPKGGDFQPDLVANKDGTFTWVLRHGVVIDFDGAGLVKALRGPGGENMAFVRSGTKLIAQRTSDGRTVTIEYAGNNPAHATVGDSTVRYGHQAGRLKEIAGPAGVCALTYDEAGHPAALQHGDCTVRLRFDDRGRLIELAGPAVNIGVEYPSGRGLVRVSSERQDSVQWHFGPRERIAGVTRGDSGILWTRNSEGRIIQMALGAIKPDDDGYEFEPEIVIGALACDK